MKMVFGILIIIAASLGALAAGWYFLILGIWELVQAMQNDALTFGTLAWGIFLICVRNLVAAVIAWVGIAIGWVLIH